MVRALRSLLPFAVLLLQFYRTFALLLLYVSPIFAAVAPSLCSLHALVCAGEEESVACLCAE